MPLLKDDKKKLAKWYLDSVSSSLNAVVLKLSGIPVNAMNAVRMDVADAHGSLSIVKKRVFLKWVSGSYDGLDLNDLEGQVAVLYSNNEEDQYAPLKVISKHVKIWKKEKANYTFWYVWWWYDKEWKDSGYVTELANLPTKEELVGKFLFLLNYPITSFARGLDAIAKKEDSVVSDQAE